MKVGTMAKREWGTKFTNEG